MNGFPIFQLIEQKDYMAAFSYVLGAVIVIFLVLPFHEFAHGWTANKLGDPTAKWEGRLSLNPMRHIDWMGAALIMFVGFGWAKPVPVNTRYFKNDKRDMAITALAGPISNLLFGLVAALLANGVATIALKTGNVGLEYNTYALTYDVRIISPVLSFLHTMFSAIFSINIGLAVFNLIPVPPLDGSRLLTAFLPRHLYYKVMQYEQYIVMGLFLVIFMGWLDVPLGYASYYVESGIQWLADLPFNLFF